MTKTNRNFFAVSMGVMVGMSAFAESYPHSNSHPGNHYPDVKSSSANSESATSNRLQDPTNPRGAYDTDKSGYANRWNEEDRRAQNPGYQRSTTTERITTRRSGSEEDVREDQGKRFVDQEPAEVDTAMGGEVADSQSGQRSQNDQDLTRQIRRELTQDDSVSNYGKNVRITSEKGMFTLRGPVSSSEEKDKIESAAGKIVGTQKVRNELEIKH